MILSTFDGWNKQQIVLKFSCCNLSDNTIMYI